MRWQALVEALLPRRQMGERGMARSPARKVAAALPASAFQKPARPEALARARTPERPSAGPGASEPGRAPGGSPLEAAPPSGLAVLGPEAPPAPGFAPVGQTPAGVP